MTLRKFIQFSRTVDLPRQTFLLVHFTLQRNMPLLTNWMSWKKIVVAEVNDFFSINDVPHLSSISAISCSKEGSHTYCSLKYFMYLKGFTYTNLFRPINRHSDSNFLFDLILHFLQLIQTKAASDGLSARCKDENYDWIILSCI